MEMKLPKHFLMMSNRQWEIFLALNVLYHWRHKLVKFHLTFETLFWALDSDDDKTIANGETPTLLSHITRKILRLSRSMLPLLSTKTIWSVNGRLWTLSIIGVIIARAKLSPILSVFTLKSVYQSLLLNLNIRNVLYLQIPF